MYNKSVSLIVPSKTQNGELLDLQANTQECLEKMAVIFGGATASNENNGAFVMASGQIMFEKNVIITAYCEATKDLKEFLNFALFIKNKYNQECIAIVVNNEMRFI